MFCAAAAVGASLFHDLRNLSHHGGRVLSVDTGTSLKSTLVCFISCLTVSFVIPIFIKAFQIPFFFFRRGESPLVAGAGFCSTVIERKESAEGGLLISKTYES